MHQIRKHSVLGTELRAARKRSGLSQQALGSRIAVSIPALRQSERGRGLLATFSRLAAELGLAIDAAALPPGESLQTRLLALRKRRGLGRRTVAELAEISPTTLAGMEAGIATHLATVVAVAAALGATLHLGSRAATKSFWTATALSSAHDGWTTPKDVLERLYAVVGGMFGLWTLALLSAEAPRLS